MAQGRMRAAALVAALAAFTCDRTQARDRLRALVVFDGLSPQGQELAGMSRPAAKRAVDRRLPVRLGRACQSATDRYVKEESHARQLVLRPPDRGRAAVRAAKSLIVTLRGDMPTACAIVSDSGTARAPSAGGRARRGSTARRYDPEGGVRDA